MIVPPPAWRMLAMTSWVTRRNQNLRLTDVARAAIDGTLDPQAWTPPARRAPP
jgi:hypothetical protein